MLLDLLGKKSMSLYIAIFMNDLAIEIKNLGLGIRVGDHDPFHTSIMHKIKTKQVTGLGHSQPPTKNNNGIIFLLHSITCYY